MNRYFRPTLVFLAALLIIGSVGKAQAEPNAPSYVFVIFETTVTKQGVETSDNNPQERRFYVSNVVGIPSEDPSLYRNASKTADDYFIATVVEPLKEKGILHQYYDDGIRINNKVVYALDTRAEVEELRQKTLQELKEQSANVFTFNWAYGEKINGLETSRPALFYHEPSKPLYGGEIKPAAPQTETPPAKNIKKNVKGKPRS